MQETQEFQVWSLGQEVGNGSPLQYACLENSMGRGAWPWGHKESDTNEQAHSIIDLLTAPVVSPFTLSALFAKPRVGKARAKRLEEDLRSLGTADTFILSWLAWQL